MFSITYSKNRRLQYSSSQLKLQSDFYYPFGQLLTVASTILVAHLWSVLTGGRRRVTRSTWRVSCTRTINNKNKHVCQKDKNLNKHVTHYNFTLLPVLWRAGAIIWTCTRTIWTETRIQYCQKLQIIHQMLKKSNTQQRLKPKNKSN